MAKKKAHAGAPKVVPPRGPATNLRPAGPHKGPAAKTRAERRREALEEATA